MDEAKIGGLQNDKFLVERNIAISRSAFLSNHYARKNLAIRMADDPRDPFGKRLHSMWEYSLDYLDPETQFWAWSIKKWRRTSETPWILTHIRTKVSSRKEKKYRKIGPNTSGSLSSLPSLSSSSAPSFGPDTWKLKETSYSSTTFKPRQFPANFKPEAKNYPSRKSNR